MAKKKNTKVKGNENNLLYFLPLSLIYGSHLLWIPNPIELNVSELMDTYYHFQLLTFLMFEEC